MSDALVVIDMQSSFDSAYQVSKPVVKEISAAKKRGDFILVVELFEEPETLPEIKQKLKKYSRSAIVQKTGQDGSKEIANYLTQNGIGKDLLVCGVNTGLCVADTVESLAKMGYVVTVVERACGDDARGGHEAQIEYWRNFETLGIKVA